MFSGGTEKDQWHQMGLSYSLHILVLKENIYIFEEETWSDPVM